MTQLEEHGKLVADLVKQRFYGELVTKFEDGRIVHVKKTESVKFALEIK